MITVRRQLSLLLVTIQKSRQPNGGAVVEISLLEARLRLLDMVSEDVKRRLAVINSESGSKKRNKS